MVWFRNQPCSNLPQGATLSQLWDSGQTLSEDSGVDIAEAGGVSKDGSPRPCKSQPGPAPGERNQGNQGPPVHGPSSLNAPTQVRLEGSGALTPTQPMVTARGSLEKKLFKLTK